MDETVIASVIAALATVIAAIIGTLVSRKKKDENKEQNNPSPNSIISPAKKQIGGDNTKQIMTDSIKSGTIIQTDNVKELHLHSETPSKKADLRIVDIIIEEPIQNYPITDAPMDQQKMGMILLNPHVHSIANLPKGFPVLDIKLRNAGTETVVLKRAEFNILKVARFKNPRVSLYELLLAAWNYDVLFSPSTEGNTVTTNISHSLQPHEAERFTFTIGQEKGAPVETPVWYYFQLSLIFNESNESVTSEPILLSVPSTVFAPGQFQQEFFKEHMKDNVNLVKEFAKLRGQRSEGVQKVIDRVT